MVDTVKMELDHYYEVREENCTSSKLIEQYDETKGHLNIEHKTHTEELRLINQDINHLEDLVKTVKSKQIHEKAVLADKYEKLKKAQTTTNEKLDEISNQSIDIVQAPKWLQQDCRLTEQKFNPNLFQMLLPQNTNLLMSLNPVFLKRAQAFPYTLPRRTCEDPAKSKQCASCGQQIHRNAPICPYCKTKTVSRNPRRYRREKYNS
ncbi:unnamed protein product [Bursaphelenchus okinawaensis]|uniref:C4H2-type domain-containing protein n=1 Tax=Bursaphelenchus okinawaensis TaxID=465554 RepID=A0A811KAC0_9BILA|nr:unnamed protein product [Bursaphelenchus okinawaensis]CAG9099425.1 unnamed protein product [Bursaphelenchus okinawaensis]